MKTHLIQRRFGTNLLAISLATLAFAADVGFQSLCVAGDATPPNNSERKAAQASFAGRFHGSDVQMRLKPVAGAWTGVILFKGQSYTVQAALVSGMLEGTFGDGQQAWPFSVSGAGDKLSFTAGSFNTALQRQTLPVAQGVYKSQRAEVEFLNTGGGANGKITFKGQQFQFTASEVAGDLEGTFQDGAQTFQFSLVPENKGWVFKTGQFSDVLSLPGHPADDFRAAAARGEANAQFGLGWCFHFGCGVARDYAEAAMWYRKAADQGYGDAENQLGFLYCNGLGVAKDEDEGVRWYRKAADQGNACAQHNLGDLYFHGRGVDKDKATAVRWYRKAADQGDAMAQYNLGDLYFHGRGVDKDEAEAVSWFRKAADQGDADAQYFLGCCYYKGQGVDRDFSAAANWYRKAADQGNAFAQNNLGGLYSRGCGVAKDDAEAIRWYRKAADGYDVTLGLAEAYLRQGNKPEAMKACRQGLAFYEKQVQSSPDEAVNYVNLSWANLLCGQAKEGEAQARKGLSAKPADRHTAAYLTVNLGHASLCQGFTTKAIEQYRGALKIEYVKEDLLDDFRLMKSALPEFKEPIEAAEKELVLAETHRVTMVPKPQAQPLSNGRASEAHAAKRRTNSLGMVFAAVPGTDALFCIWETRVRDYAVFAQPNAGVDGSWQKAEFRQLPVSNGPEHPVSMVNWAEAKAFCEWLTRQEQAIGGLRLGERYRLPTDAEWSVAAGLPEETGSTPREKANKIENVYPWGTQWPPPIGAGNYSDKSLKQKHSKWAIIEGYDDDYGDTAPVGSFKPNQYGLYDLGGNVWEWCEDLFDERLSFGVVRGGSWTDARPQDLLSSYRGYVWRNLHVSWRGFRVVLGQARPDTLEQRVGARHVH